ncbi:hypothetical protein F5B20DRAFT_583417 [Whalleya microplaca]|nr:hypothetical protein F5B20DRAFT_583417 [Whalleya microplaca]
MATFINIVDPDEHIFKNITEEAMKGLYCLFDFSNNILRITEGARTDEPYHNVSIDFSRSKYKPSQQFGDCISNPRTKSCEALTNSRMPFDVLLNALNIVPPSSYNPSFYASFDGILP